jgi:hypothetical protein
MRTTAPLEDCLTGKIALLDASFRTSPDGKRVLMFFHTDEDRWWWTVLGSDGAPMEDLGATVSMRGNFWPYRMSSPIWGHRGDVIAVDQRAVVRINPASSHAENLTPATLLQLPEHGPLLARVADGTGFYLLSQNSQQVWRIGMDGRDQRKVGELRGHGFGWMDTSPSGAYLAIASPGRQREPGPHGVGPVSVVPTSDFEPSNQFEAVDMCMWHPVRDALLYERKGALWEAPAPRWLPRRLLDRCHNASVSLDGRWIAYEMPGQEGIWVRSYEQEGAGTRITDFGLTPFWLAGNGLGLRRLTERSTLERGAVREVAITLLKLTFPDAPSSETPATKVPPARGSTSGMTCPHE